MSVAVSAVIVTLKQRELVVRCVASLLEAFERIEAATEIMVIDNGSTDGTSERLRAEFPEVPVIRLERNLGFAGGVAEGVRRTSGEWLLFLNDDAEIEPDAVAAMLAEVEGDERVGSVAAKLVFAGSGRINSAGLAADRLGIGYDRHVGEPADAGESAPTEVFGASAGAALMRRRMLEDVGGFDGSFFMYLEDLDVAWRARAHGWRCRYVPQAVARHHHSMSAGHASEFKYFHVGRNRVRTIAKNASTSHLLRYGLAMVAYDLAYVAFVAVTDRTFAPLRGRLRGLREWRTYRSTVVRRDCSELEPIRGLRAALARRAVWMDQSAGLVRRGNGQPVARA